MGVSKSDPIIIVGGGAFGLSTALHLTRDGFANVSVYEKDDHIPPRFSAANDLNKIVRAEYEDPFYTDLTIVRFILRTYYTVRGHILTSVSVISCRKLSPHGKPPCSLPISTKLVSSTVYPATRPKRPSKPSAASAPQQTETPSSSHTSSPSKAMKTSVKHAGN